MSDPYEVEEGVNGGSGDNAKNRGQRRRLNKPYPQIRGSSPVITNLILCLGEVLEISVGLIWTVWKAYFV